MILGNGKQSQIDKELAERLLYVVGRISESTQNSAKAVGRQVIFHRFSHPKATVIRKTQTKRNVYSQTTKEEDEIGRFSNIRYDRKGWIR